MTPMDIPESVIAAGYVANGIPADLAAQWAEDPTSPVAIAIAGAITAATELLAQWAEHTLAHGQGVAVMLRNGEAWEDITAWEAQRAPVPSATPAPVRGVTVTRPDVRRGGDPKRPVRLTVADTAYADLSAAEAAQVACALSPGLVGRGDGYTCVNGCAHCCPAHSCEDC